MIGFVIGNGESRLGYDFSSLRERGKVYGCNINYKDIDVDVAYMADPHVIRHALAEKANQDIVLYTREKWRFHATDYNVLPFPTLPESSIERALQPKHWGTGHYAILGACTDGCDHIFIFGFDMWKSINNKVNNVYKDSAWEWNSSRLYKPADSKAINPSYWLKHFAYLFTWFPDIEFTIVQTENWQIPEEWQDISNWNLITYDQFNLVIA